MRIARCERTVTCIILPNDLQEMEYQKPERAHGTVHSSVGYSEPRVVPREEDLRRAAEVLNAGQRVAMLVGAGAMNAADEVVQVAELLGAGVAKALLGKAVLPDDLPFVTYARYAESLGFKGLRVDRPEQIARAWDEALSADRPVVYEAYVDPDVPPLPPHITFEQAMHFSKALLKGDPEAGGVVKQSIKGMVDKLIPKKD